MSPVALLFIYCLLILLASLAGGWIPLLLRLTHKRMQLAISVVAGFMLGVGVLHLLPHALRQSRSIEDVVIWLLTGFLVMFFVERFFCFHHHDVPEGDQADEPLHDRDHVLVHPGYEQHKLTWSGAAVGLTLHSIIAGVGLAASIQAESPADEHGTLAGLAVFLVIFLHKPFDSMTLGTLLAIGRWSTTWRHAINTLFALAIPLGAALFYMGAAWLGEGESETVGLALAFVTGTFLCIAMSDLLPELQFHRHDRIKLSAALVLGLALAWSINYLESQSHVHHERHAPQHDSHAEDQLIDHNHRH
ncbi:MAG: ZIP family metal transporter [Phycisphaeraceae bacterium]